MSYLGSPLPTMRLACALFLFTGFLDWLFTAALFFTCFFDTLFASLSGFFLFSFVALRRLCVYNKLRFFAV